MFYGGWQQKRLESALCADFGAGTQALVSASDTGVNRSCQEYCQSQSSSLHCRAVYEARHTQTHFSTLAFPTLQ